METVISNSAKADINSIFQNSTPEIALRAAHFDLKGLPPPFQRLLEWVDLLAALRFNAVLVEWEDTFPWNCDCRLRGRVFYAPDEVGQFAAHCARKGLEIIPLVQSLGHSENVLSKSGYEALRELPDRTDVFHPLHPRSPELIQEMVEDVLALLPGTRRLHLGCDEAETLGQHPESRDFINAYGRPALFRRQLDPVLLVLRQRAIRPILWHDMLVDWPMEELKRFAAEFDVMVWGYSGDPRDEQTDHYRLPHVEKLQMAGFRLWAAGAFKGANGAGSNRPKPCYLQAATIGWVALRRRFPWEGVVATGWSRFTTARIPTEPWDAALDSLVNAAVILHDGVPPSGGLAACEAWLAGCREGVNFQRCRAVMEVLTEHTKEAWIWIRHLEEQFAHLGLDPFRAGSGIEEVLISLLQSEVKVLNGVAAKVKECLEGRVAEPWLSHYCEVRCRPITAAVERFQKRLRSIEGKYGETSFGFDEYE